MSLGQKNSYFKSIIKERNHFEIFGNDVETIGVE